jgi:hypothetical protein
MALASSARRAPPPAPLSSALGIQHVLPKRYPEPDGAGYRSGLGVICRCAPARRSPCSR